MQLKRILSSIVACSLGLSGIALAAGSYSPPEHLHCKLDATGKLSCADFNRKYLVEDTYTADFLDGKEVLFTFASGVAYIGSQSDWQVFFSYHDATGKNVRLKAVSYSIAPDIQNGAWKKYKNEFYNCAANYLSCSITNLPNKFNL